MSRRLTLAALPAIVASLFAIPQTATRATDTPILIAAPFEGHSGDTVFLSGIVDPHQQLSILMACPNWHDVTVWKFGNLKFDTNGPTTDGQGRFIAYPFQALTLHHFKSAGCQIYVQYGQNPYFTDDPATYTILPPGQRPVPCARQICVRVSASPMRVRSGSYEYITVRHDKTTPPWPGATALVKITYPDGKHQSTQVTLNMKGDAVARLPIDTHYAQAVPAKVAVQLRMGGMLGTGTSQFIVVH